MQTEVSSTNSERKPQITNRLRAIMIHIPWYSICGQARLAGDCGASHSSIGRLVRGEISPSYELAESVRQVVEKRLGVPLSIREIFSTDGTYPTPCVCDLTSNCGGCFPPEAWDEETDTMKPEYRDMRPGDWCRSKPMAEPPYGYPLHS
jgi:hypothetical protein